MLHNVIYRLKTRIQLAKTSKNGKKKSTDSSSYTIYIRSFVSIQFVAVLVCGSFALWPFRFVVVPVCGRFGLWPFRFVAVPVCGRFGLWPFRLVAVSVLAFRFVAVMTRNQWTDTEGIINGSQSKCSPQLVGAEMSFGEISLPKLS